MAVYAYTPTHLDGVSLTASPFDSVTFDRDQGPAQTARHSTVMAGVVGRTPDHVRSQPQPAVWHVDMILEDGNEATRLAAAKVWSPERGLVFLRWNDGDGVNWRAAVQVERFERRSALVWRAVVQLPDPVSEENAEQTSGATYVSMSGNSQSGTLNNAGDRKAYPTLTLDADAQRTQLRATDFVDTRYGFVVNRSPNALSRVPITVADRAGSDDVIDTAALVTAGTVDSDGKDIRVYYDNGEVERWLGDMNTANTRIWINASLPPGVQLTATAQLTAASPANGESISFEEGVGDLPERGVLAMKMDAAGGWELIAYTGRDLAAGAVTGIQRGIWFGQAAALGNANKEVWGNARLFVIAMGKSGMDAAPAPLSRRPCIQLDGAASGLNSHNNEWRWSNTTADSNTITHDPEKPERTAQWQPLPQKPDEDDTPFLPFTAPNSNLRWELDAIEDVAQWSIQANKLAVELPTYGEGGSNLTYNVGDNPFGRLHWRGISQQGLDIMFEDRYDVDGGLKSGETVTIPQDIIRLIAQASRAATTGHFREDSEVSMTPAGSVYYQKVVLAQDTEIDAVMLKLKTASNADARVSILDNSGATPEDGRTVMLFADKDDTDMSASLDWEAFQSAGGPFWLAAGTYWIRCEAVTAGTLSWATGRPDTQNNLLYEGAGNAYSTGVDGAALFAIIHTKDHPIQEEAQRGDDSTGILFDQIIVPLDDGTPRTPLIARNTNDFASSYHCEGVIKKNGIAQFSIDVWMNLSEVLVIDCEQMVAKIMDATQTRVLRYVSGGIKPLVDISEWFALDPGDNTIVYEETGMQNTDLTFSWRGRRV